MYLGSAVSQKITRLKGPQGPQSPWIQTPLWWVVVFQRGRPYHGDEKEGLIGRARRWLQGRPQEAGGQGCAPRGGPAALDSARPASRPQRPAADCPECWRGCGLYGDPGSCVKVVTTSTSEMGIREVIDLRWGRRGGHRSSAQEGNHQIPETVKQKDQLVPVSFRRTGKSQPETDQFIPFVFSLKAIVFNCLPTQVAQMVKNLPAVQEMQVGSWVWKNPWRRGWPIHSSLLAWKIPMTEKPGRLQSMGSQRVGHDWETNMTTLHARPGRHRSWKENQFSLFYFEFFCS